MIEPEEVGMADRSQWIESMDEGLTLARQHLDAAATEIGSTVSGHLEQTIVELGGVVQILTWIARDQIKD